MPSDLADVVEIAMCRLLHSRHLVQFVEQLVCVESERQERQSLETERLPVSITTDYQQVTATATNGQSNMAVAASNPPSQWGIKTPI